MDMGLDYSYMLYFKKNLLWAALQGVVDIAEPQQPPTMIRFPDHELSVPLENWRGIKQLDYDDPELDFSAVLYFSEDEAILDWKHDSNPPDESKQVSVGMIYLTIYTDLCERYPEGKKSDLVLFDFGTTGSKMSMLFQESASIRQTFIELLERVPGVLGVFNREDSGELFWREGQIVSEKIEDHFEKLPAPREETRFERL
jgi:hypothetical protein